MLKREPPMTPEERQRYKNASRQQLLNWLQGQSLHNAVNDECCPDFSCCHPEMLMPADERAAYARRVFAAEGGEKGDEPCSCWQCRSPSPDGDGTDHA